MRIVVALGGNALLGRGEKPDAEIQQAHVTVAVKALAPLAEGNDLIITHGNGPQVGVLAAQSAADPSLSRPYPFDVLGAQTQGMIGYWIMQALQNALPARQVASVVNQTLVLARDPAMSDPTKFVGEVFDKEGADRLAAECGWTMRQDGSQWRRVVASPQPQRVVETRIVRLLVDSGVVVVCAGGGGVPVIRDERGHLKGVEAVVDKDRTASLLAEALEADALLVLTDVPNVIRGYGTDHPEAIARITPGALRELDFPAGSMGPKIDAVCRFVEVTGDMAAIGRLEDATEILQGLAGTIVTPGGNYGGPDDLGIYRL